MSQLAQVILNPVLSATWKVKHLLFQVGGGVGRGGEGRGARGLPSLLCPPCPPCPPCPALPSLPWTQSVNLSCLLELCNTVRINFESIVFEKENHKSVMLVQCLIHLQLKFQGSMCFRSQVGQTVCKVRYAS